MKSLPDEARSSVRLSITVPYSVGMRLNALARSQGRSASNLCAFLIEQSLNQQGGTPP